MRHLEMAVERRDRHELGRALDRQRPEQERVDDGEYARRPADSDRKRHDGRNRESRGAPENPDGIADVLAKHVHVLKGRGRQNVLNGFEPESYEASRAAGVGPLRAKHLLHLAAVIRAEVERKQAQQHPEEAIGHGGALRS